MTNKRNNVIYIGVTNNLEGRVLQHKQKQIKGFTSKYNINKLVYYEEFEDINLAIQREKQIKNYSRRKKIELIEKDNSNWDDLARDWYNN